MTMFVNEKLVFVELHKTGCTHIGKWLHRLVGGEQIGKHNRVPAELQSRVVIGSVRNPWDWYVSLWAYGCSERGSVYHHTTRNLDFGYLRRQLGPEMGRKRPRMAHVLRQALSDSARPTKLWRVVYQDAADANAFREWLRMIMDSRRRYDVGEGFGFSPCSSWAGLMTYRYLKLFTKSADTVYASDKVGTKMLAKTAMRDARLPSFYIRNENLEDDLIHCLSAIGYDLPTERQSSLRAASQRKTNTSARMTTSRYYDEESIELIRQREALIIDEHNYVAPELV